MDCTINSTMTPAKSTPIMSVMGLENVESRSDVLEPMSVVKLLGNVIIVNIMRRGQGTRPIYPLSSAVAWKKSLQFSSYEKRTSNPYKKYQCR